MGRNPMAERRVRRSLFDACILALSDRGVETAEDFWQACSIPVRKANALLEAANTHPWDCETSINVLLALGVPLYIRAGEVEIMQVRTDQATGEALINAASSSMSEASSRLPMLSQQADAVIPRRDR